MTEHTVWQGPVGDVTSRIQRVADDDCVVEVLHPELGTWSASDDDGHCAEVYMTAFLQKLDAESNDDG